MRRILLACLGLLALASCGSGGRDPIVQAALDQAGGLWGKTRPAREMERAEPPRAVTRADIDRAGVAAINARLGSDPAPTLLYAAANNGGYVTYLSPLRQEITLRGAAQITGTRGLGTDLLSAWSSSPDPLAVAIPPSRWPARVQRTYQLPGVGVGPTGNVLTFDCSYERGDVSEITILQVRHRGVEISETCTGPSGSFENLHFADVDTGFVWRTLQWTGPKMELLDLQVIEPYTGN